MMTGFHDHQHLLYFKVLFQISFIVAHRFSGCPQTYLADPSIIIRVLPSNNGYLARDAYAPGYTTSLIILIYNIKKK